MQRNKHSISRYTDYKYSYPIPADVAKFASLFVNDHADLFPAAYVADIGRTDRGLVIIELNNIEGSGRYSP